MMNLKCSNTYTRSDYCKTQRITSIFTLFMFLMQLSIPSWAGLLTNQMIKSDLNADPEFQYVPGGKYQYKGLDYLELASQKGMYSIADFHDRIQQEYISGLGKPVYVPIDVGGITTFIVTYSNPNYVGSSFVQGRYIRSQIYELLGRHLINSGVSAYSSESAQLSTLYKKGFSYLKSNPSLNYGDPLNIYRTNAPYDFVWPERRLINGATVLVPVVYLSGITQKSRQVDEHSVEVNGTVDVDSLNAINVKINTGRNTFINVVKDLTFNNSTLSSSGDLKVVSGGTMKLLSSVITAKGNIALGAKTVEARTLVHRFDYGAEQGSYFGDITSISSTTGDVTVRSQGDINLVGAHVSAGQSIKFGSGGSIHIGSVPLKSGSSGEKDGWQFSRSSVDYLQSHLNASQTIDLIAKSNIVIDGAEIVSDQGQINMLAGMGITIEDDLASSQLSRHGSFHKRTENEEVYQTVAIRALLDAGKGIRLHSEYGDITLKAVDITSQEGAEVKATNGRVNLLLTKETDHYSYSAVHKRLFTTKTISEGHNIENAVYNTVVGGFSIEALKGINIQYEGLKAEDCSDYLDAEGKAYQADDACLRANILKISEMPGMAWMGDVLEKADANPAAYYWDEVVLQNKSWSERNTSLTPAAMAVISIAVAVATGPGGFAAISASITSNAVVNVAISAGFASLVNQATIALVSGAVNGDISQAMENLASMDTVKSLAISMVTAGALEAIDADFFTVPAKDSSSTLYTKAGKLSLVGQAAQAVTGSVVQAGIDVAINGGSLNDFAGVFGNSLAGYLVANLSESVAKDIGTAYRDNDIRKLSQYFAHMALGCSIGLAKGTLSGSSSRDLGGNCTSGAGGAVVGELTGAIYSDLTNVDFTNINDWQKTGVNYAEVISALAIALSGGDVKIAAFAGKNSAKNNALSLREVFRNASRSLGCVSKENKVQCFIDSRKASEEESLENDEYLYKGLSQGLYQQLVDLTTLPDNIKQLVDLIESGNLRQVLIALGDGLVGVPVDVYEAIKASIELQLTADTREDYQKIGGKLSKVVAYVAGAGLGKVAVDVLRKVKVPNKTPSNFTVSSLDKLPDQSMNPSIIRGELGPYVQGGKTDRLSVATASVEVNGQTTHYLAVNGSKWKGNAPDVVTIDGRTYNVVRTDSGSIPPAPNGSQTNLNHAEQKLFSHFQDNYAGQKANVNIAVQNTSSANPGMCAGCSITSPNFSAKNPSFNVNVFQGSTGANP